MGCDHVSEGINAFHEGDFQKAVKILGPIARREARKEPVVEISGDSDTRPEDALPSATRETFRAWEAYAGSLLGLSRIDESCHAIDLALRPMTVIWNKSPLPAKQDPRQGDYWEAEVMTLRVWWNIIPCR
jgi:hypothetical protein